MSIFNTVLEKIKYIKFLKQERGAIFVLTALLLPVVLGCMGFAYDFGNLYMHKARLQNAADAAALTGARAFVDENGFESFFNDNAGKTEKILDRIEEKVNLTLGKTKKAIINESTARTIIHNATTIRLPQPKTRIIDISNKKEEKTFSNIGMKKKITKRKR